MHAVFRTYRSTYRWLQLSCALLLCLGVFFTLGAGTASAHAKVIDSNPKANSTIDKAPTSVSVQTAENMNPDPAKSNLFVYGPNGDLVSQGNASIPLNNPREMSISIKPEGTGVYIVRWITVSAEDGDDAQGAFVFTVKAGSGNTSTVSSAPPANSAGTPPASGNSNLPLWIAIAAIAGLLVGGGIGLGVGRAGRGGAASRASGLSNLRREVEQQEKKEVPDR